LLGLSAKLTLNKKQLLKAVTRYFLVHNKWRLIMKTSGIDAGQIQAMLAQMRKAAQGPNADQAFEVSQSLQTPTAPSKVSENPSQKVDFGDVLKQ